jgi:pimeloyl-ACP methyl ester carboxylesterase
MAKGTVSNRYVEAQPRVRRGYFECRYGQLHVHNAIPPGGGFEEGTPLLCVHKPPLTGRLFERFLGLAGRDRSVYAPDIPGFGDSDAPAGRVGIADYAGAIGDFLETMRFRQIDLLGYHTGALIAAEVAITRPKQVRRLVMVSVPVLSEPERDALRRAPPVSPPIADGSHLPVEWRRTVDAYGPNTPLELVARAFGERLQNAVPAAWATAAALQYPVRERLAVIPQPVLVLRPRDDMWDATSRARELLPKARFVDLAEHGTAVFETAPEAVVEAVRDFLRG